MTRPGASTPPPTFVQTILSDSLPLQNLYDRLDNARLDELQRVRRALRLGGNTLGLAEAELPPGGEANVLRAAARAFVERRRAQRLADEVEALRGPTQQEWNGLADMRDLISRGLLINRTVFYSECGGDRVRLMELHLKELAFYSGLATSPRRDELQPLLGRLRDACIKNELNETRYLTTVSALGLREFLRRVAGEQRLLQEVQLQETGQL